MKCRWPRLVLSQLSLRAGLEMEVGKWVRNVAFETHEILGGTRRQKRARAVREVGQKTAALSY